MPRSPSAALLLFTGLLAHCRCSHQDRAPRGPETRRGSYPESDIVHPMKVDSGGFFLTYDLSNRAISKRTLGSRNAFSAHVHYGFRYGGQELRLNLSLNPHLLAPGFVCERRYRGITQAQIQLNTANPCHLIGEIQGRAGETGLAAVSSCDGLRGVFQLSSEEYFIEPLDVPPSGGTGPRPHRVYKRHVLERSEEMGPDQSEAKSSRLLGTCGVRESARAMHESERRRERWEQKQHKRRRVKPRSISKEKWVETLVVADAKMVEYHGDESVEHYILTVMNMVAGLFHDASIGNPINIVIVRLVLLEDDEKDLKITHHADNTLKSFCKWQKAANTKGEAHPAHHDVAVLITRKDICAAMNRPCETLGLSHVSGMCQPHRSCNINEDTGLPLAFTIAHELGHSFGIQHDGSGNDCEPVGKRPFIMSPQLLYDTSPLTWSRCSQDYITRFLDRGWGLCLDDPPTKELMNYPSVPPGVLYDVGHQCRLQYGTLSTFCQDIDNVCNTLWCTVGITCHSKLDAAVDGTKCGDDKWCFNGECVPVGYRPGSINGGWGSWSVWSTCTRTCGAGVQHAERQCSNPTPKYGGKFCLGERKRYRICNIRPCITDKPSFRQMQCTQFDSVLYKGKLYKWSPVYNAINPCELHCRPDGEYFSEKLLDAVIDGTLCTEGNASRDMCINGICKNVGCDYEIDSNAVEDRCGVCHGNASTCQTVTKTFEESEGLGYVDIGLIPSGAREIRIEEVAEAGNFLALRGEDPETYFLNGGWTIQWNGDYRVAGTTFTYERQGDLENLTSPGPTREPVWIQLLFQETNPGVRYQYTIHRELDSENEIPPPDFSWRYGSWTKCTATCGTGVQRQIVLCVERFSGIVEERYCDSRSRPDDQQRSCSQEPCPARWWVGEWQKCSSTCGEWGVMKRATLCIQSVALDEQRALHASECQHLPKPEASTHCNRGTPCPSDWGAGNWSECSASCGSGVKRRTVYCNNNTGAACNASERPASDIPCTLPQCPKQTATTSPDWAGSGASSRELFNEIDHVPDHPVPKANPFIPNSPNPPGGNIIPEDGFVSVHNKKGGGRGNGNAFVDDFYYDYNFITFHEDLSYDSPGEKNGAGTTGGYEPKVKSEEAPGHVLVDISEEPLPTLPKMDGESGPWHSTGKNASDANGILSGNLTKVETQTKINVFNVTEMEEAVTIPPVTPTMPYGSEENSDKLLPEDSPPLRSVAEHDPMQNSSESSTNKEPQGTQRMSKGDPQVTVSLPYVSRPTPLSYIHEGYSETDKHLGVTIGEHEERVVGVVNGQGDNDDTPSDAVDEEGTDQSTDKTPGGSFFRNDSSHLEEGDQEQEVTGTSAEEASGTIQPHPELLPLHSTSPPPGEAPQPPFLVDYSDLPGTGDTAEDADCGRNPPGNDRMRNGDEQEPQDPEVYGSNTQVHDSLVNITSLPLVLLTAFSKDQAPVPVSRTSVSPDITLHNTPSPSVRLSSDWSSATEAQAPMPVSRTSVSPDITHHNTPSPSVRPSSDWSSSTEAQGPVLEVSTSYPPQKATAWSGLDSNETQIHYDLEDHPLPSASPDWEMEGPGRSPESLPEDGSPRTSTSGEVKNLVPEMPSLLKEEGLEHPVPPPPGRGQPTLEKTHWKVGNWTKCSTTCGLGAMWRMVECSAGKDNHCDIASKPVPARRCYLRPCASWRVGNWTKCSKNCGGGTTLRDVHCVDTRDHRLLRPFHCQAVLYKPASQASCQPKPCMDWYTSSWRECSEACGGGEQERLVTCPEFGRCDDGLRPNSTRPCNTHPCTKWVVGSWGQCTASCGGGIQRRLVKCVNTRTGETEEDSSQCDHEVWPENTQKCNPQDCDHMESSFICERDRLTFSFCQTLRLLGRCHLPTVKVQCCRTCHPHGPSTRDRGNERASRR